MKSYPTQTILEPGTMIRSRHGAFGKIVRTSNRTTQGFIMYRVRYEIHMGGDWITFLGNGSFTADEILGCSKILKNRPKPGSTKADIGKAKPKPAPDPAPAKMSYNEELAANSKENENRAALGLPPTGKMTLENNPGASYDNKIKAGSSWRTTRI